MTTRTTKAKPAAPVTLPTTENLHIVGCLDPIAGKDVKMVVYARVPYDGVGIWFLCKNCKRRHWWIIDKKVRDWKE